jgi:hypothetical protein
MWDKLNIPIYPKLVKRRLLVEMGKFRVKKGNYFDFENFLVKVTKRVQVEFSVQDDFSPHGIPSR